MVWGSGDGGGAFGDPIVGGTILRTPAIQSPGFTTGVQGWIIRTDGSAEFNNLTIRGTFNGTNFVINTAGAFFYSGVPALGNLILSIAPVGGHDSFGNYYPQGLATFSSIPIASIAAVNLALTQATEFIQMAGLSLDMQPDITNYNAGSVQVVTANGHLILTAPQLQTDTGNGVSITFSPATPAGTLNATLAVVSDKFTTVAALIKNGATEQTPGYNTNWAASTTFNGLTTLQPLQFRQTADDRVYMVGLWKAGGVLPTNPIFTLPAGYRPATQQLIPVLRNNAATITAGGLFIGTSGNVSLFAGGGMGIAINNEYMVDAEFPLGNIS